MKQVVLENRWKTHMFDVTVSSRNQNQRSEMRNPGWAFPQFSNANLICDEIGYGVVAKLKYILNKAYPLRANVIESASHPSLRLGSPPVTRESLPFTLNSDIVTAPLMKRNELEFPHNTDLITLEILPTTAHNDWLRIMEETGVNE